MNLEKQLLGAAVPLQFAALVIGTVVIRVLHRARRRLTGEDRYFSFSDFLVEEQHVPTRGFVYMALPPFFGGLVLGVLSPVHALVSAMAGFAAAFLGVWPVFQFPFHLLEEHLIPQWPKLKFLYVLFVGFSATLAYLGFATARELIPIAIGITGASAWQNFVDDMAANAMYDLFRTSVLGLFVLGGVYVNQQRTSIGVLAEKEKELAWKERRQAVEVERDSEGDTGD